MAMAPLDVRGNLERVQAAIVAACKRANRSPDEVLLIAVSKTVEVERIRLAIAAGLAAGLGESGKVFRRRRGIDHGRECSGVWRDDERPD